MYQLHKLLLTTIIILIVSAHSFTLLVAMIGALLVVIGAICQATWAVPTNVGVVNGKIISIEEAPYMALLVHTANKDPCGGIIIHEQFLLTTSTCCDENRTLPRKAKVGTNRKDPGTEVKVEKVIQYTEELKPNICVVKLTSPLQFSEDNLKVRKIELDDGALILSNGTLATLTAFGAKNNDDESRRQLRQGEIPIVDNDWCKEEAKRLGDKQFCAGDQNNNACYGDAGGALTLENKLIGVVAQPPPNCDDRATRFARISTLKRWIDETVKSNL